MRACALTRRVGGGGAWGLRTGEQTRMSRSPTAYGILRFRRHPFNFYFPSRPPMKLTATLAQQVPSGSRSLWKGFRSLNNRAGQLFRLAGPLVASPGFCA
jgi:hypothetical protein